MSAKAIVGVALQVSCGILALLVILPFALVLAPFFWLHDCWVEADCVLETRRR